jgi:outer membrane lipase/esterase
MTVLANLIGLLAGLPAFGQGPALDRMVLFGDSLSDSGNVLAAAFGNPEGTPNPFLGPDALFPLPFYPGGRFSNGPIWSESFAPATGLVPAEPFLISPGGTNFAFGGSEAGLGLSLRGTPNGGAQTEFFTLTQGAFSGNELVVVWFGGNDLTPIPPAPVPDVSEVVGNVVARITELNELGGEFFLVPNLPPLGKVPDGRAQGELVSFILDLIVLQYNAQLTAALNDLESELGITIFRFNSHRLVSDAIDNPAKYGLTNVIDPAFDRATLTVAPNPDEYLFWDTSHPTTRAHQILSSAATSVFCVSRMSLALSSDESWGIDVKGRFGRLRESLLKLKLSTAKIQLDAANFEGARETLVSLQQQIARLKSRKALSASESEQLLDATQRALDALDAI